MKLKYIFVALATPFLMKAQQVMTPEILWTLNKFSVTAVEPQQKGIFYSVGKVNLETEKTNKNHFYLDFGKNQVSNVDFGKKSLIQWDKNGIYASEGDEIYISKDRGLTWTEFFTIGDADNIIIAPDGKTWFFHDHGGIANWIKDKSFKDNAKIWVMTTDPKKYIDGRLAWYSRTDSTPMKYGFGAYANKQDGFLTFDEMTIKMLRKEDLRNPYIRKELLGK